MNVKNRIRKNLVPLLFIVLCLAEIIIAGQPLSYLVSEIANRLFRNILLILALLIPVWAGLGMNFGIIVGAMSAQVGIIMITDWNVGGAMGLALAFLISIPLSLILGWLTGGLFNKTKGQEMITGMILGFFAKGIYDLIFMFICGPIIPIGNETILMNTGVGLVTPIALSDTAKGAWSKLGQITIGFTKIPIFIVLIIVVVCVFLAYFSKTKMGSDIRAVGQNRVIADSMGIPVNRVRTIAVIYSTVMAALGQIVYIQDIGNFATYAAHDNVGAFAIAALLVGGASVKKATIGQAVLGALLFHTMFVVSPLAGKALFGNATIGEYFRVFISYAVIAIALVIHSINETRKIKETSMGGNNAA